MSAPTLLDEIAELKAELRGYKKMLANADTPEERKGILEVINTMTTRLIALEARAAATAGKCIYLIIVYVIFSYLSLMIF